MAKRDKNTKLSSSPSSRKHTRIPPPSADSQYPLWAFRGFDNDGDWCWSTVCGPDAASFLQRLRDYEGMTWAQIKRASHCHFVEPSEIIRRAQKRLVALGKQETNSLFSMSVAGKPRIWGILREHVMFALWWDPNHEIWPSQKKHT